MWKWPFFLPCICRRTWRPADCQVQCLDTSIRARQSPRTWDCHLEPTWGNRGSSCRLDMSPKIKYWALDLTYWFFLIRSIRYLTFWNYIDSWIASQFALFQILFMPVLIQKSFLNCILCQVKLSFSTSKEISERVAVCRKEESFSQVLQYKNVAMRGLASKRPASLTFYVSLEIAHKMGFAKKKARKSSKIALLQPFPP